VYPRGYMLREDRVAHFGLARALRSRRERLLAQRYFSAGIAKIHLRGYFWTKNCNSHYDCMRVRRVNFDKFWLSSYFSSQNSIDSSEKMYEKYKFKKYNYIKEREKLHNAKFRESKFTYLIASGISLAISSHTHSAIRYCVIYSRGLSLKYRFVFIYIIANQSSSFTIDVFKLMLRFNERNSRDIFNAPQSDKFPVEERKCDQVNI